ncbi:hypothetical protein D9M72_641500 [compost metagenome]
MPYGFPAEETDQARGERRQAFEAVGAQGFHGVTEGIHGVPVDRHAGRRLSQPVRLPVLGGQGGA